MNRDYRVSKDGIIFEIREDGGISKIAKIEENGNLSSLSGRVESRKESNGDAKNGIILFFIALAFILAFFLYVSNDDLNDTKRLLAEKKQEINVIEEKLSNITEEYPMTITDIQIANVYKDGRIQTDYGYKIYSENTMYLKPKISYIGYINGNRELKVKLFNPDGSLSTGDSSPAGFSQSGYYTIYEGANTMILSGWGNSDRGNWGYGKYRIEIWCEDVCLKSKTFWIYW